MSEASHHHAERGLFELRRGRLLRILGDPSGPGASEVGVLVASVEGLTATTLDALRKFGSGPLHLVMTPQRGDALGLVHHPAGPNGNGNGRAAAAAASPRAVALELPDPSDAGAVLTLAGAAEARPDGGSRVREATRAEAAAVALVRLGGLLPAVVALTPDSGSGILAEALRTGLLLDVEASAIEAMTSDGSVELVSVSEAPVPLEEAENARFVLFREAPGLQEHVAILVGNRAAWPDPVPVRLHSACLTGDIFGSLRCDCGEQLRGSLTHFARSGGGVLLYLAQEGRGIGLGNKFRAYTLQEGGLDTVDADHTLGFGADERRYDVAVEMLRQLRIDRVQLLTNNPEKLRAVREGGIHVLDRRPLHGKLNRHNLPYVRAKVHRAGHWLHDMLASKLPEGDA